MAGVKTDADEPPCEETDCGTRAAVGREGVADARPDASDGSGMPDTSSSCRYVEGKLPMSCFAQDLPGEFNGSFSSSLSIEPLSITVESVLKSTKSSICGASS